MDKDGNGFITADELKQGMVESVRNQIQKRINQAMYVLIKLKINQYPNKIFTN